jgi:hypothetical protein
MADPATLSILETTIRLGYSALAKKLATSVISAISGHLKNVFHESIADIDSHLKANYERCLKIKTILNRHEPVDLLAIYVGTNFVSGKKSYDHFDFIDALPKLRRIVVSGTGGGGKTVFMKYLWLSIFSGSYAKIPLFVELRKLNEISSDDLMVYVHRSIIEMHSKIDFDHFGAAVHQGAFCFIFDGFDEIHGEKKGSVERQILKLAQSNPGAWVIVSGRPDPRFGAWQNFTNLEVQALTKEQTIRLITKLDYDKKIKYKFIDEVKKRLYERHTSFLSNPLLATMMLLTFDQFAEIPEKMFLFYEQAFDTLFLKHDATKEGFQRKKHADITIDIFKKYLSYFCLFSYYEEKFEFTDEELLVFVNNSIKAHGQPIDAELFIHDLVESVCIMQREGIMTVFTHRSFQEYFAAYCMSLHVGAHFDEILLKVCSRWNDSLVRMLFEMNREKVESRFVIPIMSQILEDLDGLKEKYDTEIVSKFFEFRIIAERHRNRYTIFPIEGNEKWSFLMTATILYRDEYSDIEERAEERANEYGSSVKDDDALISKSIKNKSLKNPNLIIFGKDTDEYVTNVINRLNTARRGVVCLPLSVLDETFFMAEFIYRLGLHRTILDRIKRRNEMQARKLTDILGLTGGSHIK